jgi:hypothetical protein
VELLESFIESKHRGSSLCEDFIFANDHFLAVFDGATDKTEARYDGMPGGKFAVETLARRLDDVALDISAGDCIRVLSEELRRMVVEDGPEAAPSDHPSASVVIYSEARSEIWRVGDCSWAASGSAHIGRKPIDVIVALARAALLQALLEAGHSVEELRASDRGREMVLPLLKEQYRFRNLKEPTCDLGFGAIDGQEVPERFIETTPIKPGEEVVLATDGYPRLLPTLRETEDALAQDLLRDPLRIGQHKATKAVAPGQTSFDDRAFLRFRA